MSKPGRSAADDAMPALSTEPPLASAPKESEPEAFAADDSQLFQTVDLPGGAAASGDQPVAPPSARSSNKGPGLFPVRDWDRYEFVRLLGQGGMGAVYEARDRRIHRTVALKFIRGGDERLTQRFMQEARAQARIDHIGICKVLEVGEVEGKAYIAMQIISGMSLLDAKGQLKLLDKVGIIQETAEALHAAHELGIIHRDIKPANVTIEREN